MVDDRNPGDAPLHDGLDDALGAVLTRTIPTEPRLADAHRVIGQRIAARRRRRVGTRIAAAGAVVAVLALGTATVLDDEPVTVDVVDEPTTVGTTPSTDGAPSTATTPTTVPATAPTPTESTTTATVACELPTVPGPDGAFVALYCGTDPLGNDPLVVAEVEQPYDGYLTTQLARSLALLTAGEPPPTAAGGTASAIGPGFIAADSTVTIDGVGAVVLDLHLDLTAVPNATTSNVSHRLTRQLLATFFAYEEVTSVTLTGDCIGDQECPLLVTRAAWLVQEAAEQTPAPGAPMVVPLPDVGDVSVGGDGVFVTGFAYDPTGTSAWYAARVDPATGLVVWQTELVRVARRIVATPGVVWVFGGGDGGEPEGVIVALDPTTGAILAGPDHSDAMGPYDAVATGDDLWVSNSRGEVVRVAVEDGRIVRRATIPIDGQPSNIVLADDGRLWVLVYRTVGQTLSLVGIDPVAATVVATYGWDGPIHDAATGGAIWAQQLPDSPVLQLQPDALADGISLALGTRLPPVRFPSVVAVGEDVWVGTGSLLVLYTGLGTEIAQLGPYEDASVLAASADAVWFLGDRLLQRWSVPA
jgi:hypothetical protein